MTIVDHFEKFLGAISQGWRESGSGVDVQIACIKDSPTASIDAFVSLGLSDHVLRASPGKEVRQELILPVSSVVAPELIVSCLLYVSRLILKSHRAVLRGQVIRLPPESAGKSVLHAVYCGIPVFLDDEFSTFPGTQPPTVVVWTIPIFPMEADFIDANGWDSFEDILEKADPLLFSLERKPAI